MPPYFEDFKDFIRLLQKHEVEYMIVGAYAVAIYAEPRATGDIDFWINPTKDNVEKVLMAVNEFGFEYMNLKANDLLQQNRFVQLGVKPCRIDILNSIDGVAFGDAYQKKHLFNFDDIKDVMYISAVDLRKNKSSTGRLKDKADVESLSKIWKRK